MFGKIWTKGAIALGFLGLATAANAVECRSVLHLDQSFTVCTVQASTEDLRLFHKDGDDGVLGGFAAIERVQGPLVFAMNAGMYHADRDPVGLYIEDGVETAPLVTRAGPGNFGLMPNGVLCLTDTRAEVIESLRFDADGPECRDATQSGPMLVIDGALHPRFIENGTSRYIRNGVGTSADGSIAHFAISDRPVNFYDFGTLFRNVLNTPNALYFDGNISRLYAPAIGRDDFGVTLGPMIGVLAPPE